MIHNDDDVFIIIITCETCGQTRSLPMRICPIFMGGKAKLIYYVA